MFEELQKLTIEPLQRLNVQLESLVAGRLWLKVIIGMTLGVAVGFALGPEAGLVAPDVAEAVVSWLALPGLIFLRLVQMIVVALIFASIIRGLGSTDDVGQLRALGMRAAAYFVMTSAAAIALGITVALLVEPGSYLDLSHLAHAAPVATSSVDVPLPERIVNVLPTNPIAAMAGGEMLEIVMFALVVGVALVSMPVARSKPLFELLGAIQDVCMTVVKWAMRLAPLAVFGLMTRVTATLGFESLTGMGIYVLTVLLGLLILVAGYVALVAIVGRISPLKFLAAAREVQLLAFSTSSSAAVMPLSLKTAEEKLGVRPESARLLIPLGATINMDGTALYQGVATIFLAQAFSIELGFGALVLVIVTAVAASIGAPATPGVGIVVLATVLSGVGIPPAGVAIILGVDRLLDMTRTAVNVTGDLAAAVLLDRWVGDRIKTSPAVPETP